VRLSSTLKTFTERHAAKIRETLTYFDKIVIASSLADICHAGSMAKYLGIRGIRLFVCPRWAVLFRDEIPAHTGRRAHPKYAPHKKMYASRLGFQPLSLLLVANMFGS